MLSTRLLKKLELELACLTCLAGDERGREYGGREKGRGMPRRLELYTIEAFLESAMNTGNFSNKLICITGHYR